MRTVGRIQETRNIIDDATGPPWGVNVDCILHGGWVSIGSPTRDNGASGLAQAEKDATFTAHARTRLDEYQDFVEAVKIAHDSQLSAAGFRNAVMVAWYRLDRGM